MAALSAVVFALSWWLGLYLLARDPRKPILAWSALGLCSFAVVVAVDAVRLASGAPTGLLSHVEAYLAVLPGIAWLTRSPSRMWQRWQVPRSSTSCHSVTVRCSEASQSSHHSSSLPSAWLTR